MFENFKYSKVVNNVSTLSRDHVVMSDYMKKGYKTFDNSNVYFLDDKAKEGLFNHTRSRFYSIFELSNGNYDFIMEWLNCQNKIIKLTRSI